MNKIICDECKAEIQMTRDLIETKHLKDGIQINFFRCKKCNSKYLVDVTDRTTREKQDRLRNYNKEIKRLMESVTDLNLISIEKQTRQLYDEAELLEKEIKEAKTELKKKYEGEL